MNRTSTVSPPIFTPCMAQYREREEKNSNLRKTRKSVVWRKSIKTRRSRDRRALPTRATLRPLRLCVSGFADQRCRSSKESIYSHFPYPGRLANSLNCYPSQTITHSIHLAAAWLNVSKRKLPLSKAAS